MPEATAEKEKTEQTQIITRIEVTFCYEIGYDRSNLCYIDPTVFDNEMNVPGVRYLGYMDSAGCSDTHAFEIDESLINLPDFLKRLETFAKKAGMKFSQKKTTVKVNFSTRLDALPLSLQKGIKRI